MQNDKSSTKPRATAAEIKAEIDRRLAALDGGKSPCCRCRVSLPRKLEPRERWMYDANWIIDQVEPHVRGCDQALLEVIVSVMRIYDCADWA